MVGKIRWFQVLMIIYFAIAVVKPKMIINSICHHQIVCHQSSAFSQLFLLFTSSSLDFPLDLPMYFEDKNQRQESDGHLKEDNRWSCICCPETDEQEE